MKNFKLIIFSLIIFQCSSKQTTEINEHNKDSTNTIKTNASINSKDTSEVISTLFNANDWYKNEIEVWRNNFLDGNVNTSKILLDNCEKSDIFSKKFIETIQEKSSNFQSPQFGEYFYDKKLGRLLNSFSTNNKDEIEANLTIYGFDSARYNTLLVNVLNDVPYNDDTFEWLSKRGKNSELWLHSILLIKEKNKWKIEKTEIRFDKYIEHIRKEFTLQKNEIDPIKKEGSEYSCKFKYSIISNDTEITNLPKEVLQELYCPDLLEIFPDKIHLIYKSKNSIKLMNLNSKEIITIHDESKIDGVSNLLWNKKNDKFVFVVVNENSFQYKAKIITLNYSNGSVSKKGSFDAPVNYLCGSYCNAIPGDDFWFNDNETAIEYNVNTEVNDIPNDAGILKIK